MTFEFLLSIEFWIVLAVGAVLILLGTLLLKALREQQGKSPSADGIIQALLPFVYKAIFAGEHYARLSLQNAGTALDGLDRKLIADTIYDALPPVLMIGRIPIPIAMIKYVITRERFEAIIEDVYKESKAFILRNDTYIRDQVGALKPGEGVG